MTYKIVNKYGTPLDSFHGNAWCEVKEVFPCSNKCYLIFSTLEEAREYLDMILIKCEEQRPRWGDATDKMLEFAHSLRIA